jgi:hypothetical protein
MKNIVPYKTQRNALASLDNGGRFFNIFTKSSDGEISSSELAKLAGVFTDKQKMFLYLEMSLAELGEKEAGMVRSSMSEELQLEFKSSKPAFFTPVEAMQRGRASKPAVITGIPHYTKSKTALTGFIMVPISTGKSMTMIMVPIMDYYDVYEVHDMETSDKFIVAHARGRKKLLKQPTRFGGILKEIQKDKKSESKKSIYLEAIYYSLCR